MHDLFRRFAHGTSMLVGSQWAFAVAVLVVVVWAFSGPVFGFSDTWQLVINTGTTVVTFLIVFLIQNTQNRDSRATHLKLDEIIRSMKGARNQLIDLEERSDEEIAQLERQFRIVARRRGLRAALPRDADDDERRGGGRTPDEQGAPGAGT